MFAHASGNFSTIFTPATSSFELKVLLKISITRDVHVPVSIQLYSSRFVEGD